MKNPVEEFLLEKQAFNPFSAVKQWAGSPTGKRVGERVAEGALLGGAFAGTSAVVAGTAAAANKLYDAATKKRDFDNMLEANPHLKTQHEQDPESFNRMFTSLRSMNPEFTRDPMVAGAFMFEAMEQSPEERGFVAVRALREGGPPPRLGPAADAALSGFQRGAGMDLFKTPERPRSGAPSADLQQEDLKAF